MLFTRQNLVSFLLTTACPASSLRGTLKGIRPGVHALLLRRSATRFLFIIVIPCLPRSQCTQLRLFKTEWRPAVKNGKKCRSRRTEKNTQGESTGHWGRAAAYVLLPVTWEKSCPGNSSRRQSTSLLAFRTFSRGVPSPRRSPCSSEQYKRHELSSVSTRRSLYVPAC